MAKGKKKQKRLPKVKPINNFLMMSFLTLFQIVVSFCAANAKDSFEPRAMLAMAILIAVEWIYLVFFTRQCTGEILNLKLLPFS